MVHIDKLKKKYHFSSQQSGQTRSSSGYTTYTVRKHVSDKLRRYTDYRSTQAKSFGSEIIEQFTASYRSTELIPWIDNNFYTIVEVWFHLFLIHCAFFYNGGASVLAFTFISFSSSIWACSFSIKRFNLHNGFQNV